MLRRTLSGYHLQYHHATQDAFPHHQPHHTLHRHLLPHGSGVLLALGLRGEDCPVHQHPVVVDGILSAVGRDYSSDFVGGSLDRLERERDWIDMRSPVNAII